MIFLLASSVLSGMVTPSFSDDLGHRRISASASGVSRTCDEHCFPPLLELTRRRLNLT